MSKIFCYFTTFLKYNQMIVFDVIKQLEILGEVTNKLEICGYSMAIMITDQSSKMNKSNNCTFTRFYYWCSDKICSYVSQLC